MRSSTASFSRRETERTSFVHRAHRAATTGSSIAVIDFGEIAQPAVADWRKYFPGWADIGVAARVGAKLVLAEEALADRGAALRSGNVRNATGPLAGFDVFDFEVAAVGDDVDRLDVQNLAGGFCSLRQQAHVDDLVGHRLLAD